MIVEYQRPKDMDEALKLIGREDLKTVPIGGGSAFDRHSQEPVAVVDLQALELNTFQDQGNFLGIGATLTLQAFLDNLTGEEASNFDGLRRALLNETSYNLRQVGTAAGTLVSADGRSPFTTVMLALDAVITFEPGTKQVHLGDFLPLRSEYLQGHIITQIVIPKKVNVAYDYVARSPADRPIVCAGAALWPSGRARVALGGFGSSPILVLDGPNADGVKAAASAAYSRAEDQWASAEYRENVAGVLAQRVILSLSGSK